MSQMRLAIARGISLCASGGCAARARSRAAQLEASAKCSPWDCAIQMPGGEPLSLTRGRACPGMVCHGTHQRRTPRPLRQGYYRRGAE